MSKIALYPGTFDPLTLGHLDVIERAHRIFDRLIVGVAVGRHKKPFFALEERVAMIKECLKEHPDIEVEPFDGLLVNHARKKNAGVLIRGLRAFSDFEFEFQMAHMNRRLNNDIDTVFMMTGEEHFYVSSQLVREIASFGGDVSGLVPSHVDKALQERFSS